MRLSLGHMASNEWALMAVDMNIHALTKWGISILVFEGQRYEEVRKPSPPLLELHFSFAKSKGVNKVAQDLSSVIEVPLIRTSLYDWKQDCFGTCIKTQAISTSIRNFSNSKQLAYPDSFVRIAKWRHKNCIRKERKPS